ncbi:hybrid sensor histidine kinase/response regulator [Luteibacter sahnii]|uniref:hybrid sensor histidine kinase/response regulator n=1 Tax=Luteibacter sahnii TaxID=3021977 RepID=UPI002A6A460D|nr:ATP-binding protein [Luteibacter sp. PPL193]MDY1547007.1 ATP-binding protein [Luteibacter sp. PPL193]
MQFTHTARWMLALVAALLAASVRAGAPQPPVPTPQFRSYSQLDGLPSSNVQAVAQDSRGFLWVATPAGLARFDGAEFTLPGVGTDGRHPLLLNGITAMAVDHDDRIWIGGSDIGVARFDVDSGHFVQWRDGLSDDDVRAIAQSRDGSVWVGTASGLDRILPDGSVERMATGADAPGVAVHALHATDDGQLWIGDDRGVMVIDARRRFERIPFVDATPRVRHVGGRSDDLLFSTDRGVYRLGGDGRLHRDTRLPAVLTYATLNDSHGNLWVAHLDGLSLLDRYGRLHDVRGAWVASRGMPGRNVRSLVEDAEHGVWFGLADGGLAYLGPGWDDFSRFTHVATDADSLPARAVTAVAAKGDAALWVGGYRGWIRAFDPATGKASAGFDVGPARIQSLLEVAGQLFIGTVDGLSVRSRGRTHAVARERLRRPVTMMVRDGATGLYVAAHGQGLFRLDARSHAIAEIPFESPCRGMTDTRQMDLVHGELWQASVAGLARLDASRRTMRRVEGVAAGRINAFEPDDEGFWVVRPDVLEHYAWDGRAASLDRSFGGGDGFPTNDILNIRRDLAGRLWLYGQTGVWRFDPAHASFRRFGLADGLSNGEFTHPVTVQLADGSMYGATLGGLVGFRPDHQRDHTHRPSPAVLGATVSREGRREALPIEDGLLRIGWNDRDLEIRARALSFVDPDDHRLRVTLERDGDAIQAVTGRAGDYRPGPLAPGRYRLVFVGMPREPAAVSSVPLDIRVDAPPWMRWWAWMAYAGAVAVAAGAGVRRTRRRVRQAMRLRLAEQERQLAEQANAAKTEFMATLGHEIRTPMTGVLGMAELIAQTPLDPTQRTYVEAVRRSGATLLRLINDALDISRIESRQLVLENEVVPVRTLADEVVALAGGTARAKQLALTAAVDADVPEAVVGDTVRLRQILQNLVNNAVKFTERGAVSLHVGWIDDHLVATVRDTGPGMSGELLGRLFSRFSQGGSPQRAEGSGLGLAICHELCALMGGSVTVDSRPGHGSVFVVRLPLAPSVAERGVPTPAPVGGVRCRRLLVVEDDPMIAEVMLGLLRQRGHEVTMVGDGLSAMSALSQASFDVLLLDLDLPMVSGFQVARMVRRIAHLDAMPIVAVTARSAGDENAAVREAGMDGLVRKPMTGADLDAVLDTVSRSAALAEAPEIGEGADDQQRRG